MTSCGNGEHANATTASGLVKTLAGLRVRSKLVSVLGSDVEFLTYADPALNTVPMKDRVNPSMASLLAKTTMGSERRLDTASRDSGPEGRLN